MYPISQINSFVKSGDFFKSGDSRCFLVTEVSDLGTSRRLVGDSRRFGRRRCLLVANKLARATLSGRQDHLATKVATFLSTQIKL